MRVNTAVFLTLLAGTCCLLSDEFSDSQSFLCNGPPVHVVVVVARDAWFRGNLPKAASLTHSLIMRSGCARDSRVTSVDAAGLSVRSWADSSPTTWVTSISNEPALATVPAEKVAWALREAAALLGTQPTTSRKVVVIVANLPTTDSHVAAAASALQHSGVHVVAVTAFTATDRGDADASQDERVRAMSALVSHPPARNLFLAHRVESLQGSFLDIGAPVYSPDSPADRPAAVSLPFDPRSIDSCVRPVTCAIGGSGVVRAGTGDTYAVATSGDYMLASYRTPTQLRVDVVVGVTQCGERMKSLRRRGCVSRVAVYVKGERNEFVSVRSLPNAETEVLTSSFGRADVVDAADADVTHISVGRSLRVMRVRAVPTWRDGLRRWRTNASAAVPSMVVQESGLGANGYARGGGLVSSYTFDILDAFGSASGRVTVDVSRGVMSATMFTTAEAVPIRSGLCGAPAAAVGEDAAPAVRQSLLQPFAFGDDSVTGAEILTSAASGASLRERCPPAAVVYRVFDRTDAGVSLFLEAARLLEGEARAHAVAEVNVAGSTGVLNGRESIAARSIPTARISLSSFLESSELSRKVLMGVESVGGDCGAFFGGHSQLARICVSTASVDGDFAVYSTLRLAASLCRSRCLHPDEDLQSSIMFRVNGGRSQADLAAARSGSVGTEILDNLVSSSWCEVNICKVGRTMLSLTNQDDALDHSRFVGSYEPLWLKTSAQREASPALLTFFNEKSLVSRVEESAVASVWGAGVYTFQASVTPRQCPAVTTNVTVAVRCPQLLNVPDAGPNVVVERSGSGFPPVSLLGRILYVEDVRTPPSVELWWSVADFPSSPIGDYGPSGTPSKVAIGDTIRFPYSAAAVFHPPHAGDWRLSFSVFDGCAVRTDFVTVSAVCGGECMTSVRVQDVVDDSLPHGRVEGMLSVKSLFSRVGAANAVGVGHIAAAHVFNYTFRQPYVPISPSTTTAQSVVRKSSSLVVAVPLPQFGAPVPTTKIVEWAFAWIPDFLATTVPQATGWRATYSLDIATKVVEEVTLSKTEAPVAEAKVCGGADVASAPLSGGSTTTATQSNVAKYEALSTSGIPAVFPQLEWRSLSISTAFLPTELSSGVILPASRAAGWNDISARTSGSPCTPSSSHPLRVPEPLATGVLPVFVLTDVGNVSSTPTDGEAAEGLVFSSFNSAVWSDCRHNATRDSAVWVATVFQPVAHTVTARFHAASFPVDAGGNAPHNATDGFEGGFVWIEQRTAQMAGTAGTFAGRETTFESVDRTVEEGAGSWALVAGTNRSFGKMSGSFLLKGLVKGPAVVRVVVRVHSGRILHLVLRSVKTDVVAVGHSKSCDGQEVVGKVQATDGCSVVEDSFSTTLNCPPIPGVHLVTPHLQITYDYDTMSWPTLPLLASVERLDGAAILLSSAERSTDEVTKALGALTFDTVAFEHVEGYAPAEVDRALSQVLRYDDVDAAAGSTAACTPLPASAAIERAAWRAVGAGGPNIRYPLAVDSAAVGVGPLTILSNGARPVVFVPMCTRKAHHSWYAVIPLSFPTNVTHLNMTFGVQATFPTDRADHWWSLSVASFATHDGDPLAVAAESLAVDIDAAVFRTLHNQSAVPPLSAHRGTPWSEFKFNVPVATFDDGADDVHRFIVLRLEAHTPTIYGDSAEAGRLYVALSPILLTPVFVSRTFSQKQIAPVAIKGPGVARIGVTARGACRETTTFVEIDAKCPNTVKPQKWEVWQGNSTNPQHILVRNSSAVEDASKVVVGDPTAPAVLKFIVVDGLDLTAGTGLAYGSILRAFTPTDAAAAAAAPLYYSQPVARVGKAGEWGGKDIYEAFAEYGPGAARPWNGSTIDPADLESGLVGIAQVPVVEEGTHALSVRFTDGCRELIEVLDVVFKCSNTLWGDVRAVSYTTSPSTPVSSVRTGVPLKVRPQSGAAWLPPQQSAASGAVPIGVDDYAWVRYEVFAVEPRVVTDASGIVTTDTLHVVGSGSLMQSWKVFSDDATGGSSYLTPAPGRGGSRSDATFIATGAGQFKIRVTFGFENDCSTPDPYIISVSVTNDCLPYTVTHTPLSTAKFQRLLRIVIPTYVDADFEDTTSSQSKIAILSALNSPSSFFARNGLVASAASYDAPGKAVTIVTHFNHTDYSTTNMPSDIRDKKAFQRQFGYISFASVSPIVSVPIRLTMQWSTSADFAPLAVRRVLLRYPVGGSTEVVAVCDSSTTSVADCPALSSRAMSVNVDFGDHSLYSVQPDATDLAMYKDVSFTFEFEGVNDPCERLYRLADAQHRCRNLPALAVDPVGVIGVARGVVATVNASGSVTSSSAYVAVAEAFADRVVSDSKTEAGQAIARFGVDETRTFQRVYLFDRTPTKNFLRVGGESLPEPLHAIEYQWVVSRAPEKSLYAPLHQNRTAERSHSLRTSSYGYYATKYSTSSAAATLAQLPAGVDASMIIPAYLNDPGTHYYTIVQSQTVSESENVGHSTSAFVIGRDTHECLSAASVLENPRGEACWTPDVAGEYVLTFRATHAGCNGEDRSTDVYVNKSITIVAQCPPFDVTWSAEPKALVELGGSGIVVDTADGNPVVVADGFVPFSLNVTSDIAVSHPAFSWKVDFLRPTSADVAAQLVTADHTCEVPFVRDPFDASTALVFDCPGVYRVTAVVTDGCTVKELVTDVTVQCKGSDILRSVLRNASYVYDVPEASVGGPGRAVVEVPLGTAESLETLARSTVPLACLRNAPVAWKVVAFHPATDVQSTSDNSYPAARLTDTVGGTRVLTGADIAGGSAAEARMSGLTTFGDVVSAIATVFIGLGLVVVVVLIGKLLRDGPGMKLSPEENAATLRRRLLGVPLETSLDGV